MFELFMGFLFGVLIVGVMTRFLPARGGGSEPLDARDFDEDEGFGEDDNLGLYTKSLADDLYDEDVDFNGKLYGFFKPIDKIK